MRNSYGFRDRLTHTLTLLGGMALGAGLMYVLDPVAGARRRSYARDRLAAALNDGRLRARQMSKELVNRGWGSAAEALSTFKDRVLPIPDDILRERVRAQLGHVIQDSSFNVEVVRGEVIVTGAPSGEEEKIRERLEKTRGVRQFRIRPGSGSHEERRSAV